MARNSQQQLELVESLERRLLAPGVRSSRQELEALLAEAFVEFGSSGRAWTKSEIIADLTTHPGSAIEIDSVESRFIGEDVILVTYRSRRTGEADANEALRASIWQRQDGDWKITFHQGTGIRS